MKPFLIAALTTLALAAPAQASFTSAYTDLRLDQDCLVLEADDFSVSWSCPGYKGYPVLVREGDLRFAINYGFGADQQSNFDTLPPFNRLGEKLEWRLSNAQGRWMPIATIVRFYTSGGDMDAAEGQVLMVTQLVDGNSCAIAYIDARANVDANELARQAADAAGSFDCAKDAIETLGKAGVQ
ncbi:MAG: hypothetical protein ACOH2N_14470 [Devosia sp.]|jgi:hypothetical protein